MLAPSNSLAICACRLAEGFALMGAKQQFDLDLAALLRVRERDVRGEVALETVLEVLDRGCERSRGAVLSARGLGRAALREVAGDELLRRAHSQAALEDLLGEQALLVVGFEREQHFCVADGDAVLRQPALHLRVEIEQPHAVRDGRAALADLLRDVLLPQVELPREPREGPRLLDRIEVFALEILDERELEHVLIGRFAQDHRHLRQPDPLRRAPAAFAGDQLIAIVPPPHDERLDDAVLGDGIDELLQLLVVENGACFFSARDNLFSGF